MLDLFSWIFVLNGVEFVCVVMLEWFNVVFVFCGFDL